MKQYRFDYIKKWTDRWNDKMRCDADMIKGTPFGISLPLINLNQDNKLEITPSKDYYGEVIEDANDWMKQRNEYCEKLAEENRNKISNNSKGDNNMAKRKMTPEDRLLKAIYGDKWKTEAKIEAEIDEAVSKVTDEEYKRVWGKSIDESVGEIMDRIKKIENEKSRQV